jgi:Rv0078B-related antitoxin
MQSAAEKLRIALQMHAEGVAMHRLTLRRKHPEFSTEQIEDLVYAWLCDRPGAPFGDGEGTPHKVSFE